MIFPYFLPRALVVATFLSFFPFGFAQESQPNDPCAEIGRKEWATPAEVRACYKSYPLDPIIKSNVGPELSLSTSLAFLPAVCAEMYPCGSSVVVADELAVDH